MHDANPWHFDRSRRQWHPNRAATVAYWSKRRSQESPARLNVTGVTALTLQDIPAQARIRRDPDDTVHSGTVLVEPGDRAPLQVVLHQGAAKAGDVDAEALLGVSVAHDP
jgi:hypothetical protein